MNKFIATWFPDTTLLFYGQLEEVFLPNLEVVLESKLNTETSITQQILNSGLTHLEFWLILSEADAQGWFDYGTSPGGGWLTQSGMEFLLELKAFNNVSDI